MILIVATRLVHAEDLARELCLPRRFWLPVLRSRDLDGYGTGHVVVIIEKDSWVCFPLLDRKAIQARLDLYAIPTMQISLDTMKGLLRPCQS